MNSKFNSVLRKILFISFLGISNFLLSQNQYIKDNESFHHLDRIDHLYRLDSSIHFSIRNVTRGQIRRLLQASVDTTLSSKDKDLSNSLLQDHEFYNSPNFNPQKGWLNTFYKNSSHFFEVNQPDFNLVLNPILNVQFGRDFDNKENIFLNQRGLELWGQLDKKFYFFSSFFENQSNFFNYINPFIEEYKSIPGQGNYKNFDSKLFKTSNAFDYSNAVAYLGFNISKNSNLELGHGHHFFGNGVRSLLLSDFANNYFYLKLNIKVWKIHYQSIFAELNTGTSRFKPDNILLPKKYKVTHYLSFKFSRKLEIGLFESVIFSRENQFEFQYLNPVILYRTVEHFLDSPDNVLIGLNLNYKITNGVSFYSQLLLDEFKTSEIFSGKGWWGNKLGYQLGLKYFDVLNISQLDAQLEFNSVRPYTYSHHVNSTEFPEFSVSSYSHYNQALAHPLGSNFAEVIFKLRYKANTRILLEGRYIYTKVGRNDENNYGSDILLTNSSRFSDFGNNILQGAISSISHLDFNLTYNLFSNFNIDLFYKFRTDKSDVFNSINTNFVGTGIRYNIDNNKIDY